jgi:hypothetical protein
MVNITGDTSLSFLCVFLDAVPMSDDELVEVPGKQLFQRSSREVSVCERQPDVERNAATGRGNALEFIEAPICCHSRNRRRLLEINYLITNRLLRDMLEQKEERANVPIVVLDFLCLLGYASGQCLDLH